MKQEITPEIIQSWLERCTANSFARGEDGSIYFDLVADSDNTIGRFRLDPAENGKFAVACAIKLGLMKAPRKWVIQISRPGVEPTFICQTIGDREQYVSENVDFAKVYSDETIEAALLFIRARNPVEWTFEKVAV